TRRRAAVRPGGRRPADRTARRPGRHPLTSLLLPPTRTGRNTTVTTTAETTATTAATAPTGTGYTAEHASALVGRLRAAFRTGRTKRLAWRERQLVRLRALLTENGDDIAAALHTDLRKGRAEAD